MTTNPVNIRVGLLTARIAPVVKMGIEYYTISIGDEEADVCKFDNRKDVLDTAVDIKRKGNYATGHVKVIRTIDSERVEIPI